MNGIFDKPWILLEGNEILFNVIGQGEMTPVKENARRKVWRVALPDDTVFYVKYEKLPLFSAAFYKPARKEFANGEMLASLNIPCVKFTHCAICNTDETLLISAEVPNSVSAKEFWFKNSNAKLRRTFLENLRLIIVMMMGNHLQHGDFHAGNLLVNRDTAEVTLVDPLKIDRDRDVTFRDFSHICANFLPDFTLDDFRLLSADFTVDAEGDFRTIIRRNFELIAGEWERRKEQILSGKSKFSRTVTRENRTFEVASDVCFAPQELPENIDDLPCINTSPESGDKLWTLQFREILEGRRAAPQFIARENLPNGTQNLYQTPAE